MDTLYLTEGTFPDTVVKKCLFLKIWMQVRILVDIKIDPLCANGGHQKYSACVLVSPSHPPPLDYKSTLNPCAFRLDLHPSHLAPFWFFRKHHCGCCGSLSITLPGHTSPEVRKQGYRWSGFRDARWQMWNAIGLQNSENTREHYWAEKPSLLKIWTNMTEVNDPRNQVVFLAIISGVLRKQCLSNKWDGWVWSQQRQK